MSDKSFVQPSTLQPATLAIHTNRAYDGLRLCTCAESLGSVETLITNPATASHCDIPSEERSSLGITDRLIRLSVGLEDPRDLIPDFEQSFAAVFGGAK